MHKKHSVEGIEKDGSWFGLNNKGYYIAYGEAARKYGRRGITLHMYTYLEEGGPIGEDEVIHHIDLDKSNNDISNLQCMKRGDHATYHRLIEPSSLRAHLKRAIRCVETNEVYTSITEAVKQTKASQGGISNCLAHRTACSGGYTWEAV